MQLSREIRAAGSRLRELSKLVISIYGPNHRAAFEFEKVVEALGRLQRDLQVQAAHDHPGSPVDGLYE